MLKQLSHPYVYLTLTAFIWGGNAVAGKLAVGHVSPMILTLLRWVLAVAVLTPFAAGALKRDWPMVRRHLPLLVLLGVFGFTGFNALFYLALNHTSAINVVIEQASMPLFVFLASFLVFRERATVFQVTGFLVSVAGVALTASHGDPATLLQLKLNIGDALILVAVLIYAGFTVAVRFKPDIHWLSLIYVLSLSALATSIPLALIEIDSGNAIWPDREGLAIALFTALFPSIVSQSLYIKGIAAIGANRANLFVNLTPIFGAGLAVAVLGEPFFAYHALALALVLSGIALAEQRSAKVAAR